MLFEQKRTRIQRKEIEGDEAKLDVYFKTVDPESRKAILDHSTAPEQQEVVAMLRKFFDIRYQMGKNGRYADSFLRHFIEMRMVRDNLDGWFSTKKNLKTVKNALEHMCLVDNSEFPEEILYGEMCQLVALYIETCYGDTNYTAIYCGFGKISDASIRAKLQNDLDAVGEIVPKHLHLEKECRILTQATKDMAALYL